MSSSAVLHRTARRRARFLRKPVAYAFIAPFLVVFLAMVFAPLAYAVYASMFQVKLIGGSTFVGLGNYLGVLTDPSFYAGLGRVVLFMSIQIPLTLGLALVYALAFDSGRMRWAPASRLIMFLPNAVPAVVAALMWGYLYGKDFGPISQVFQAVGRTGPDLLSSQTILYSIVNIAFWSGLGFSMVILYSALQSIPSEIYEAARIDGASELRIAWSLKVPAVIPSLVMCAILALIGGFQLFNEPNLLAPIASSAIPSDFTPNLYIYRTAFASGDIGYATAMSIVLGLVIIAVSLIMQAPSRKRNR